MITAQKSPKNTHFKIDDNNENIKIAGTNQDGPLYDGKLMTF